MLDGVVDAYDSYELRSRPTPPELVPDAIAGRDMLYSSGTTGRPKGIKAAMPADPVDTPTAVNTLCVLLFGATTESVYLSPAPLYHSAPLRFTMAVSRAAARSW